MAQSSLPGLDEGPLFPRVHLPADETRRRLVSRKAGDNPQLDVVVALDTLYFGDIGDNATYPRVSQVQARWPKKTSCEWERRL